MANIHQGDHELSAQALRPAGIIKERHATSLPLQNDNLVGNIADGRYFAQQLINGQKLRHALRQAVLPPQAEIRQQGGQRRAVLYAPGKFCVAALDRLFPGSV